MLKFLLLGNSGVGKTSLLSTFDKQKTATSTVNTIGKDENVNSP